MNTIHRFYAVLLCLSIALISACNPVPLSVVASDFSINGVKGTGTVTSTGAAQAVTIDLTSKEACSTLTSLVAVVKLTDGVTISPDPAVARDYTSPFTFTVTESYGTKVVYTVTVKGKACDVVKPTTVTTTACTAATISSTGYSLVFKGCDASNVATYYDKTECVRENATGLIWQGQTPYGISNLRGSYQLMFNFDSTTQLQKQLTKPNGIDFRAPTQAEVDDVNNTIGFKSAVNATNLCGGSNWRLPTKNELLKIVKPVATPGNENPTIDQEWFPNTQPWSYWTSTPNPADEASAWIVEFYTGTTRVASRDCNNSAVCNFHLVRLVRAPI